MVCLCTSGLADCKASLTSTASTLILPSSCTSPELTVATGRHFDDGNPTPKDLEGWRTPERILQLDLSRQVDWSSAATSPSLPSVLHHAVCTRNQNNCVHVCTILLQTEISINDGSLARGLCRTLLRCLGLAVPSDPIGEVSVAFGSLPTVLRFGFPAFSKFLSLTWYKSYDSELIVTTLWN